MKVLVEEENEGLQSLVGKTVTLLCMNYFYTGKLVGVNDVQIKLAEPSIVYETGEWGKKEWGLAERLPVDAIYVRLAAVEAYGVLK